MNMAIPFDTLKYVERLKSAGVSEVQAKAMSEAQKEVFTESIDTTLATKSDILELKQEITSVRTELKQEITSVRTELKEEITSVRTELKEEISEVRSDVKLMKWMLGFLMTGMAALIIKSFFGG